MEHMKDIDELSEEEKQLRALVQMNHRRVHASRPDVDEAWSEFQRNHAGRQKPRRRFSLWHMSAAALIGAAAMLAVVFLFPSLFYKADRQAASSFVALQYDQTPQHVKWEQDDETMNLGAGDSLSFLAVKPSPAIAADTHVSEVKTQRLSTPRGMDFKVTLPDGSEVWLNAESTIEFPAAFRDGLRQVYLQGEAYFKVAHCEDAPFIVMSDRMNVRVLGTSFNFRSYDAEAPHVALVEGKVEVMRPGDTQPDAILQPGEEAWLGDDGALHVQEVDTYAITQWVNGFFYFHNEPLVEVLRALGRWYNYGVIFHNTDAMHQKIHFSALRNDHIGVAIESLNRLRHVYVQIEGDNLVVY